VTTGGDAPGMNAAIRAVARIAHSKSFQVIGFERGWEGLLTNACRRLTPRSVGGIIQLGGTILHTTRCPEFKAEESLGKAAETLDRNGVDGLVVIGGDVYGTDETIGFDTAVNTAVSEIDKIRDTAISHERLFVVEVMGRKRGFLALHVGISVGAEVILIPEKEFQLSQILEVIKENTRKGKRAGIIVAAEGIGDTSQLARELETLTSTEVRLSIVGYAQRGGSPTARSRVLASLFAERAVDLLASEIGNQVVGLQEGKIVSIGLKESSEGKKSINLNLLKLADTLAI
jgi:6-phosphofructokinase 1